MVRCPGFDPEVKQHKQKKLLTKPDKGNNTTTDGATPTHYRAEKETQFMLPCDQFTAGQPICWLFSPWWKRLKRKELIWPDWENDRWCHRSELNSRLTFPQTGTSGFDATKTFTPTALKKRMMNAWLPTGGQQAGEDCSSLFWHPRESSYFNLWLEHTPRTCSATDK